jgi:uncharacterized protein (TIGR02996 family)
MEEALLGAIVAKPDELTPRLVYADWLDETGDPANADRAEFIRVQCRLDGLSAGAPERPALVAREEALLKQYAKTWAEPLRGSVRWWTYHRGFIESAVVPTEGMRDKFGELYQGLISKTPFRDLILFEQTDDFDCLLDSVELLRGLSSFSARHGFLLEGGTKLRKLFACPQLVGLRRLELEGSRNGSYLRPRVLSAILQLPTLSNLTELVLADYLTSIHPTVVRTVCRSPVLSNLKRLSIEATPFDGETMRRLLRARFARKLEVLELRRCRLDPEACAELVKADALPSLRRLMLGGADADTDALIARYGSTAVDTVQEEYERPWYYDWHSK